LFTRKILPRAKTDVRYAPTIDESIARLKATQLGELKQLYQLIGASHAQVTVIGDFEPTALEQQLASLWGSWKSTAHFKRIKDKYSDTPGSAESIDTPDKENALILAGYALAMRDDDPDYPAARLVNYVLGAGFGSRLLERLRQKDGLSYGAGSSLFADSSDVL